MNKNFRYMLDLLEKPVPEIVSEVKKRFPARDLRIAINLYPINRQMLINMYRLTPDQATKLDLAIDAVRKDI